jgi:hypothetical protein
VMKTTKTKISHNTQIFFYRLDQENMLEEIVAGYGSDYLIER